MSGNPYEKDAQDLFGSVNPPSPANPYLEDASAMFGDRKVRLESALDVASRQNPDEHANAIRTGDALNVPTDVVMRQPKEAEAAVSKNRVDIDGILDRSPIIGEWLSNHQNAAVAHDDIDNLSGLEYLLGGWYKPNATTPNRWVPGAIQRAVKAGSAQRMLAEMQRRAGELRVDPETMPGYQELSAMSQGPDTSDRGLLTSAIVGTTEILPGMALGAARGGAYAATTEAAFAAAGGPAAPITAAIGAAGPAEIAFLFGIGKDTYDQEYGGSYAENVQRQKAAGGVVNYDVAHRHAVSAALANAALEVGGTELMFGIFPVLGKVAAKGFAKGQAQAAAKEALAAKPGPIKSALKAVFRILAGTTEEATTEALQRGETAMQAEESVLETGGTPDFSRIAPEMATEFRGAFQSMFLLGAFGAAGNFASDVHDYRTSVRNKDTMRKIGAIVQASKLNQRLPEKLGEIAGEMVKQGAAPENVYVPIGDFVRFWQEQEQDPKEIARQLGQSGAYEDALSSRADVAIPFETYVEKIAGGKYHAGMSEIARFDPDGMTPAQGKAFAEGATERIATVADEIAAEVERAQKTPSREVRDKIVAQLVATGKMTQQEAEFSAMLPASLFSTLEARTGQEAGTMSPGAPGGWQVAVVAAAPADEVKTVEAVPVTEGAPAAAAAEPEVKTVRATRVRGPEMHGSDVTGPEDVPRWIRSVGGISIKESSQIKPGSEDAKRIDFSLKAKQGGRTIENLAAELVEAGHFEDVNTAQDWILDAITNPTGMEKPASMGGEQTQKEMERSQKAAFEKKQQRTRLTVSALLEPEAVPDALARIDAGQFDSVMAWDLKDGEVIYHDGQVVTVGRDAEDREVLRSPQGDRHLGAFEALDVIRLGMVKGGAEKYYQSGWHGSPHRFERFQSSKIGTGEGNQAYGHGLYFSSKRDIGEYYRQSLADLVPMLAGNPVQFERGTVEDIAASYLGDAVSFRNTKDPYGTAVQRIRDAAETVWNNNAESDARYWQARFDEAIDVLKDWQAKGVEMRKNEGQLYRVALPEDEELLSFEKKLKDQSANVLEALNAAGLLPAVEVAQAPDGSYRVRETVIGGTIRHTDDQFDTKEGADRAAAAYELDISNLTGADLYYAISARFSERGSNGDVQASEELRAAGIAGHTYKGDSSGTKNFVIYDDSAVGIVETFFQDEGKGKGKKAGKVKRGYIEFTKGGRSFKIGLLQDSNLSTFLHETGHMFLEVMGDVVEQANAPQQIKDDYATALKWLGVTSRDQLTGEHHEKWANGFEDWLMEGRAPSVELAGAFERFRSWLVQIYKTIARNVTLTKEVRDVMARLVATDEEIASAEHQMAAAPMFLTMDDGAMTIAQWARYRDTANQATYDAQRELQDRLLAEVQRERKRWWKEEYSQVEEEVTKKVDADPGHRANAFFRRGVMLDGSEIPPEFTTEGGAPKKLSRQDVFNLFGRGAEAKAILRKLNFALSSINSVSPESAAPLFGFQTGNEMVRGMLAAGSREKAIHDQTEAIMKARHGDIMSTGAMAQAAQEAAHSSEGRLRQYEMEYNALTRKAGTDGRLAPARALQQEAARQVSRHTIRTLDSGTYLRAEAQANRVARGFERRGEWDAARAEVQRAVLNHYLYRETVKAQDRMQRARTFLEKANKESTRARLGKAGLSYQQTQDKLLEAHDFRRSLTDAASDKRIALRDWIAEQEALGQNPEIADSLLNEAKRTTWRNMTVQEILDLEDAVRNVQHQARLKLSLLTKKGRREAAAARDELKAAAEKNRPDKGPPKEDRNVVTVADQTKAWFAEKDAALLRIETLVNWLDGGDIEGPWHRYVLDPIEAAKIRELDLEKDITKKLADLLVNVPKEVRAHLEEQMYVEGIGQFSRLYFMAIALNAGNEGNYQRLIDGNKFSDAAIQKALRALKPEEMDYVQGIWNVIDELRPEAAALYRRRTGLEFPRVEPKEFTIIGEDGVSRTYAGGYFPVKYNRLRSIQGENSAVETVSQFFENATVRAVTSRGYSKDRIENYAKPLNLNLLVIPNHVAEVIHDIAFGEAVTSVGKILLNPEVRQTMQERLGEYNAQAFIPWLKGAANYQAYSVVDAMTGFDKAMETRRAKTTAAVLALKMSIACGNFANFFVAMKYVRPDYLAKGVLSGLRHPVLSWRAASEESGEVRHRMNLFDRDIREQQRQLRGKSDWYSNALRFGYAFTAFTDVVTSVPIYYGAKAQAIAKGHPQDAAIRAGNAAIRNTMGSGHPVDLPAVMRARGLSRAVTMFYGYSNSQYQALRSSLNDIQKARLDKAVGKRLPYILAQSTAIIVGNAIIGELLAGRGPGEDEPWWQWLLMRPLLYPFETIPGLRDVARAIESKATTGQFQDFNFSPLVRVYAHLFDKAIVGTYDVFVQNETVPEYIGGLIDAGTLYFGVPGQAQLKTTGTEIWDLLSGETQLPTDLQSFQEFSHDVFFTKPQERR